MRRRDRHFTLVLIGLIFCNLVTGLVGIVSTRSALRRAREAEASAKTSEKTCIEASAAVVSLAEQMGTASAPSDSSDDVVPVPRVVGYGQSRSKRAIYVYRDVEFDGVVRREYVQRIPLQSP